MLQRIDTRVQQFIAIGAAVILLQEPPFVNSGNPTQPTSSDVGFEQMNALLREVAARHPAHVEVINLESRVCPSGPPCPATLAGLKLRPDHEHYGPAGSLWVAEWLMPRIVAAAKHAS